MPEPVVEEVRRAADILDVASEFAESEFRRVGREHVARCPYPDHDDKTPSFYVNPEKGVYLCRGCKKGGDAIDLVKDLEELSFADAVRWLAERHGVDANNVPAPRTRPRKRREERPAPPPPPPVEPVRADLEELAARFRKALTDDSLGARYLASRNIPLALAREYGLGYARPGEWPADDEWRERKGETPRHHWRFGRIVVPHEDPSGRIVNLYGRAVGEIDRLPPDEREQFRDLKHRHLFRSKDDPLRGKAADKGWFNARVLGEGRGTLVVVEGVFDALAFIALGYERAVAIFSAREWRWPWVPDDVRREGLVLAFDSDETGLAARNELRTQARLRGVRVAYLDRESYGGEDDPSAAYAAGKLVVGAFPKPGPEDREGDDDRQRRRARDEEKKRRRAEAAAALARAREEAELNAAVGPAPKSSAEPRLSPATQVSNAEDTLTVERALAELRRESSGPALALSNHRDSPGEKTLTYLVRAVLHARGLDPGDWREHRGTVKEAVEALDRERTLEGMYEEGERRAREHLDRAVAAEPADIPDDPRERLRRNVARGERGGA